MINRALNISTLKNDQSLFHYQLINPASFQQEMPTIWNFVAANLASQGDVSLENAISAAKSEKYDEHANTRIIKICGKDQRMVGTFSLTKDSQEGMPVADHFEQELVFLRKKHSLINGWRFSMLPLPSATQLRNRTFAIFKLLVEQSSADAFALYFNKRLDKYYQRYFNGQIVATKTISFDGINELPVSLFIGESSNNPPEEKYLHEGAMYENPVVF